MDQHEPLKQPFFARFLELQHKQDGNMQGIFPFPPLPPRTDKLRDHLDETQKFPSDNDEDIFI
jgi:hypothetical protein